MLAADALDTAAPLLDAVRDPALRAAVTALGGYDLRQAGSVDHLG